MTRADRKKQLRALAAKTGKRPRGAANILARERHEREVVASADDPYPPSHYDENRVWYPLRRDGAWLDEAAWERNLRVLRSRDKGRRALTALAQVFTPSWSREQSGTQGLHPVVYDSITIGGRHKLLEVGFMLATMPENKRLRERLLHKDHYRGTCAELRGGLVLRTAGAATEWEPVKDRKGPDWLARWPAGVLAAEVKGPRESKQELARQAVLTEFCFEFMRRVNEPLPTVDTGVWLTLHPSKVILEVKTVLGSPDLEAVRLLANEAAEAVRQNMPRPTAAGRFSAGRAGEFTVALGLGDEARVQLGMQGLEGDHERDGQRLFETIQEAAEQLRAVEEIEELNGVSGLVIIDAEADFKLLNHLSGIYESIHSESWAAALAGVAVITSTGSIDDDIAELRTDTIVRIIPGPRNLVLEQTLLSGLRMCDRGHLHSDPLMAPAKRCQLVW